MSKFVLSPTVKLYYPEFEIEARTIGEAEEKWHTGFKEGSHKIESYDIHFADTDNTQ